MVWTGQLRVRSQFAPPWAVKCLIIQQAPETPAARRPRDSRAPLPPEALSPVPPNVHVSQTQGSGTPPRVQKLQPRRVLTAAPARRPRPFPRAEVPAPPALASHWPASGPGARGAAAPPGESVWAMNSGERKLEAAGPRGRRARRPREQVRPCHPHSPCPVEGADRDVQLSKALSYALRHGALKLGLAMGAGGFVPLGALLQLPQFRSFSAEDVQRVVDTNGKQRFALQPGDPSTGPLIRANQGHSLQVPELELMPLETPQDLPPMLVHGTFWQHWPSIRLKGLSCRGRTHIHLATGLPGDPGVISDGIPFLRSVNGVILTPGNADGFLLPKYFKEALQLRPTRKPLSLAGDEETECQSGPQHSSRGRRMSQQ
ncbi:tRNA 2'-phosphotransferase 1 isoform X3 [Myotis daubentonii]|uniref:tRNA 2'-phosphotransferase 1 isoform X3 n=1 Tax=Myotis daubentonii TaxID=98922 RepID=UPI002872F578|nr:tRNA 2'-phosphotransferase 1 isoform X3 [Myotis daubentonii]